MSRAYYNEFDPYAAQWLRNLVSAGHIAPGDVDERSIVDVQPDDLEGYTQCHFFAGIGGWSLAARLAGWSDSRPLWTGSCPCQPFSVAGKGEGQKDERHLWPEQFRLIRARRPDVWMGEQVAAAVGKHWLDGVHSDLESIGYASGAAVVPACAVDAPHRRDRAWIVADARSGRCAGQSEGQDQQPRRAEAIGPGKGHVANAQGERGYGLESATEQAGRVGVETSGAGDVAYADQLGESQERQQRGGELSRSRSNSRGSAWVGAEWLRGADGKARRFEPSIRLLLDGFPAGLARLRASQIRGLEEVEQYGNASERDADEVLRMVRDAVREEACWQEPSARMRLQLPAPQVLLGFLLCLQSACETEDAGSIKKGLNEAELRLLRGLRQHDRDGGASCGRQPAQQHGNQSTDALLALSFVLARYAETYRQESRSAHAASNRVGMLRAFGNAIVPQVAAEVIAAYLDAEREAAA